MRRSVGRPAALRSASLLAVTLAAIGCGTKRIPNTQIEDTPEHRAILDVVERYRRAAESRDAPTIVGLTASTFFEDHGTSDPSDDFDRTGLERQLAEDFGRLKAMTLEVSVREVQVKGDAANVDYFYSSRYQLALPSGDVWQVDEDVNRMRLAREGGQWRIVSGI